MHMLWACTLLTLGVLLLWKGADLLVSGGVSVAEHFGIAPLIIGLTIVAMGTSAPEVAASIAAVLGMDGGDVAVGNICGSNVANMALVGGVIALIHPIVVARFVLWREIPLMIGGSLLLWPILGNGFVSRWEAAFLLAVFAGMTLRTVIQARRGGPTPAFAKPPGQADERVAQSPASMPTSLIFICLGLVGLAAGGEMAVSGARTIGQWLGLSDAVIGIAIVAPGTSLPEFVTCVVAASKGHHDISVGNLVGSNTFNALLVTGCSGLVAPFSVSSRFAGGVDYWAILVSSLLFWGIALRGKGNIGRLGGATLLIAYVAYVAYTVSKSTT